MWPTWRGMPGGRALADPAGRLRPEPRFKAAIGSMVSLRMAGRVARVVGTSGVFTVRAPALSGCQRGRGSDPSDPHTFLRSFPRTPPDGSAGAGIDGDRRARGGGRGTVGVGGDGPVRRRAHGREGAEG